MIQTRQVTPKPEEPQKYAGGVFEKRIVSETTHENPSKLEENGVNSEVSQKCAGVLFENVNSLGTGEGSKDDLHKLQEVKTLGKIVTVANQVPVCPTCGNKFLAVYHLGAWRCNQCGDTSANY